MAALDDQFGDRVEVLGGAAGLHVCLRLRERKPVDVPTIRRRASGREVGVYSTEPCYLGRPRRAELLLGHGSLSEDDITEGISRLAAILRVSR